MFKQFHDRLSSSKVLFSNKNSSKASEHSPVSWLWLRSSFINEGDWHRPGFRLNKPLSPRLLWLKSRSNNTWDAAIPSFKCLAPKTCI